MSSCEKLYEYWQKVGNFCGKSENTAKVIDEYIKYRRRHRLEASGINRTAMYPLLQIEDKTYLHQKCLKSLRSLLKKVGGRNITRRMIIELINNVNNTIPSSEKITHIPGVRAKMEGNQHAIEGLSWETKEEFKRFKSLFGEKTNDVSLRIIFEYLKDKTDSLVEFEERMSSQINKNGNEEFRVVSTT